MPPGGAARRRPCPRSGPAKRRARKASAIQPIHRDEIVVVMRRAQQARYGARLNGLIVVLWRAGLRIHEALLLLESDLDQRRGSILVRHGKNDRRREVGMDAWAWSAAPAVGCRACKAARRPAVLRDRRPDSRPSLVGIRRSPRAAPNSDRGRCASTDGASSVEACARCRAAARRDRASADPAPARAYPPVHHGHLPIGDLFRGDHLDGPARRAPMMHASAGLTL